MNSKKKRKFRVIHLFLILFGAFIMVNGYHWWTFSKPFDKAEWIAGINDTESPTLRKKMLKNIQSRLLQPGMTQMEIIETLGSSDTDEYFREHDLVYWIGPDSSYIDSEWLVIDFGEEGKLVSTAVVTD
jgi:uncharacterized protein YpmB